MPDGDGACLPGRQVDDARRVGQMIGDDEPLAVRSGLEARRVHVDLGPRRGRGRQRDRGRLAELAARDLVDVDLLVPAPARVCGGSVGAEGQPDVEGLG